MEVSYFARNLSPHQNKKALHSFSIKNIFYDKIDLSFFYFDVAIYEIETVTSGLFYIEDLGFLENNVA